MTAPKTPKPDFIVSKVLSEFDQLELLYASRLEKTALGRWRKGRFEAVESHEDGKDKNLVPIPATNNLIRHKVILLPSYAESYQTQKTLLCDIQSFIHRYCDLGPDFEIIAAHYVLLTWVYDRFRELPYLRLQGDFGTGKTRFLQVVGSLCYKPLFASGASTISPIFHALDMFQGTLVMDEADFRFSDEKSDIIKILNNGNAKGFPLLRSEVNSKGQYNPRAFHVYGPKILATRGIYRDPALESRCITYRAKTGHIRKDIPLTLPDSFESEAEALRNQCLMFRFKTWPHVKYKDVQRPEGETVRISQIFRPLICLAEDDKSRQVIANYAKASSATLKTARAHSPEEHLLGVIQALIENGHPTPSIKMVTDEYRKCHGEDHTAPVSPKWVGGILRSQLHLSAVKRGGVYILPETEGPRLQALYQRYGINK